MPTTAKKKNPKTEDLTLRIIPELQNLLPPLSESEYTGLEADIVKNGCLSPLVVWDGAIVDGHNRHAICLKHDLPFKTTKLAFESLDEARLWAWQQQEHRRNLTPFQRTEIALQFKSLMEAKVKQKECKRKSTLANSPKSNHAINTRVEIAKIAGVGDNTVSRVEFLTKHADEPTKQKLRKGETTVNAEYKRLKKDAELREAKQKVTAQIAQSVASNSPTLHVGDGMAHEFISFKVTFLTRPLWSRISFTFPQDVYVKNHFKNKPGSKETRRTSVSPACQHFSSARRGGDRRSLEGHCRKRTSVSDHAL